MLESILISFVSTNSSHFFLTHDSHMSGSTWFISLKVCVEFSAFDFVSFLKFTFLFNKRHELYDFKMSQILTQTLTPRPLILKLQKKF